ncbi:7356_t:CDS:2, partial [Diversispora eburnea]
ITYTTRINIFNVNIVKRMWSDTVPLSSEDYKFIMQYRDAKPKTDILKKLRERYPMTNNRFYKIWRGQEVCMVEWHQLIPDTMVVSNQNISISESCSSMESTQSNIDQGTSTDKDYIENSIVASNKRIKKRKSKSGTSNLLKIEEMDDLYTLIERERKGMEEALRESE